jgi:hypothetical protein
VSPQSHNYCADHGHGRAASHVYAPLLFGTAFAIGTFLNLGSSPSSSCVACSLTRPLCSLMPGIIILPTPSGSWRHGSRPFSRAAHPARLTPMTSGDRHRRERPDRLAICGRSPFGHEPARRFLHMADDALLSVEVVIAGVLILVSGWTWLDPLVSLVLAVFILAGTWGLLRD